jgi:hypothetical protein
MPPLKRGPYKFVLGRAAVPSVMLAVCSLPKPWIVALSISYENISILE